jgi:hypothetical protein
MVVKRPTYEHRNSPVVPIKRIKREGCERTSGAALPILKQTPNHKRAIRQFVPKKRGLSKTGKETALKGR